MTANAIQARMPFPIVGLTPIEPAEANAYLREWGHKLGPVNRPFRMEAWALEVDGRPVCVAVSASTVSSEVAAYRDEPGPDGKPRRVEVGRWRRTEAVELARLCAEPGNTWVNRAMLRLWREVLAPRWACWPVKAAISYSKNATHTGDLYRFDGWEKCQEDAGSSGGGRHSRKRCATDAVYGPKTLWVWRYGEKA